MDDLAKFANLTNSRVLQYPTLPPRNFYLQDEIFRHFMRRLSPAAQSYIEASWELLGEQVTSSMDRLSLEADQNGPTLSLRDLYGEPHEQVQFHPSYHQLMGMAVSSNMLRAKWEPTARSQHQGNRNFLSFGGFFLFSQGEAGIGCPLCMTDGAATVLDRYGDEEMRARIMPQIFTSNAQDFFSGAMFMTEKAGGSDVGANVVQAISQPDGTYQLFGEKWFCSNVNAEVILALARTPDSVSGIRGLSLFLIERNRQDGTRNWLGIQRLKDKLGVRSMASAECVLNGTEARLIGEEGDGFKLMASMVNLSRIYNSMSGLALMRRAMIEVWYFLSGRISFGKPAMDHPLIRTKLMDIGANYLANFYLTWHMVVLSEQAEQGNLEAIAELRFLTPLAKKTVAADAVEMIQACMELMGGIGYIEQGIMPKLMRDALVLPIWEGASNIMVLDMLRASEKSEGLDIACQHLARRLARNSEVPHLALEFDQVRTLFGELEEHPQEIREASSKPLFEAFARMYQWNLMRRYRDETSVKWLRPATKYWQKKHWEKELNLFAPPSREDLADLWGWMMES
ncbi:acyl-CoA dehydrogenase family protein [Pontibacter sp. G13]|uniref:acyl-CoA dehydrogenase family protein n=1 Tax=Pontibacter sp. G13 TaxID=3074898 RepID=UPI0028895341|nr:acyl-CoA dehydrogenase family protein [Pontibacter sp. G13]WNJ18113.1 acyl-CoA dehydrogenase family protein [Pontibacter sp. G13]